MALTINLLLYIPLHVESVDCPRLVVAPTVLFGLLQARSQLGSAIASQTATFSNVTSTHTARLRLVPLLSSQ